jgi:hypothetical protein
MPNGSQSPAPVSWSAQRASVCLALTESCGTGPATNFNCVNQSSANCAALLQRLQVSRIVRPAPGAANREIVHLAIFGVQQDRAAMAAGIVNRVVARIENRRCADHGANPWGGNGLQADFTVRRFLMGGHSSCSYATGGSVSQPPTPRKGVADDVWKRGVDVELLLGIAFTLLLLLCVLILGLTEGRRRHPDCAGRGEAEKKHALCSRNGYRRRNSHNTRATGISK